MEPGAIVIAILALIGAIRVLKLTHHAVRAVASALKSAARALAKSASATSSPDRAITQADLDAAIERALKSVKRTERKEASAN